MSSAFPIPHPMTAEMFQPKPDEDMNGWIFIGNMNSPKKVKKKYIYIIMM